MPQLRIGYADGRIADLDFPVGRYRIGRDVGELVLGDPNTSALHAELDVQPGQVLLIDLGSTNGTFDAMGGRLVAPAVLQPNQPMRLGSSTLTLLPAQPVRGATQVMSQFSGPIGVPAAPPPNFSATPPPVALPVSAAPPPGAGSPSVRGTIIKVPDQSPGLLFVNGSQLPFGLERVWRSPVAPLVNQVVDVELSPAGVVVGLTAVDAQQLTKERLNQFGNEAQEQAKRAAQLAKQGASALLGGKGALVASAMAIVLLLGAGAYGLGFGRDLSKRGLASKIDEKLTEMEPAKCWALQDMAAPFPFNVSSHSAEDPILKGLAQGGYITIGAPAGRSMFGDLGPVSINLTDKGKDAKVWDLKSGFCVGSRQVDEVLRWTEPADSGGVQAIRIEYTWKYVKRPSWVSDELLPNMDGISKPKEGMAIAQKTSDGWRVVMP
ncbi:MAG: FHA domain-containing protein [Polyangiaceae bacterium]